MSLITAKYIRESTDTPAQLNTEHGWREVNFGLRSVALGYMVLLGGAILGFLLLRMGLADGPFVPRMSQSRQEDQDLFLLLGLLTLGMTAMVSCSLLLVGQWRCLLYTPPGQSSRELMYVSFNLLLVGSLLAAVGVYLDGARTFAVLSQESAASAEINLRSPGTLLFLIGVVLGLISSLVFSQFLRSVASSFQNRRCVRGVDLNLGFIGLVVGGSAGALPCVSHLSFRSELVPWLIGGWLLCFLWHLYLVSRVNRCVERGLPQDVEVDVDGKRTRADRPSSPAIPRPSGLHRTTRSVES